jgi:hypothetical protein
MVVKWKRAMKKRILLGLLIFIVACVCLVPYESGTADGIAPLRVTVASASSSAIASVSCEPFSSEEAAQYSLDNALPPTTSGYCRATVADPFVGKPLEVNAPFSYRYVVALLWKNIDFHQMHVVVVIVHYKDGRCERKMASIPNLRKSDSVESLEVEFP